MTERQQVRRRVEVLGPQPGILLVGSYASVARMLDEAASVPGTKGIMLTFDDFVIGMEQLGRRIQPLMASRSHLCAAA
ncbi:MAG: hypothetical protein ACJ8AW_54065 [Rhodopila sp.]